LNPRPLGYEPYDICLWRLEPSLAGVVISANSTDPISLCRLRLARLKPSRRVRFTNRFTGQAIDLQFPYPSGLPQLPSLDLSTVSGFARQRRLRECPTVSRGTLAVIAAARPARGTGRAVVLPRPFPNPTAAGPCGAAGFCPGVLGAILSAWRGIVLISSSVTPVRTGLGRSGWPGS
jgi:hypothetical protein